MGNGRAKWVGQYKWAMALRRAYGWSSIKVQSLGKWAGKYAQAGVGQVGTLFELCTGIRYF